MVGIVLTHLIFTQNGRNVSKPPDRWPVAEAVAREGRMGGWEVGGHGGEGGQTRRESLQTLTGGFALNQQTGIGRNYELIKVLN